MAVLDKPAVNSKAEVLFVSAEQMDELHTIVVRQFEELGIQYNPDVTAGEVRQAMRAEGIRAENNEFSCGIIAARGE